MNWTDDHVHDQSISHYIKYCIFCRYLYNESINLPSVMTALTTLYAAHKYMCPGLAKEVSVNWGFISLKPIVMVREGMKPNREEVRNNVGDKLVIHSFQYIHLFYILGCVISQN